MLEVRVQPRAGRNSIEALAGGAVKVCVTAAPEGGKANAAVIELLAERLGVAKSSVQIVKGHAGRSKLVHVEGLTADEAIARLSAQ
jgi:uncharacterized protein (TIGR00251 family)